MENVDQRPAPSKICPWCSESKGLSEFHNNKNTRDRKCAVCKKCANIYGAKRKNRKFATNEDVLRLTCGSCKIEKSLKDFNKDARGTLGRHATCRSCDQEKGNAYNREHSSYVPDLSVTEKTCCRCHKFLPIERFGVDAYRKDGYSSSCKSCKLVSDKARRKTRVWTPQQRIASSLRSRVRIALKGGLKSGKTKEILGCSWEEAVERLKHFFEPGWTLSNFGKVWHIDHIRPVEKFDLTDPEQQKICFHYSNIQPLHWLGNLRKGTKYNPRSFESAWVVGGGYTWCLCDNKRFKLPIVRTSDDL
jgi:hypothetical protein